MPDRRATPQRSLVVGNDNLGANPLFRDRTAFASAVGTNLKKLSSAEMTVLTRHAAALLTSRMEKYAPELKQQA